MHMQLAILCLCVVGAASLARNVGGCSSAPCARHLGVYFLTFDGPSGGFSSVITYYADGTASVIDSTANGNLSATPPRPPYSSSSGVWKCDGANGIKGSGVFFVYSVPGFPGALGGIEGTVQFDGKGGVTGSTTITSYDLISVKNPDKSKWIKIEEPDQYTVVGYKLYSSSGSSSS